MFQNKRTNSPRYTKIFSLLVALLTLTGHAAKAEDRRPMIERDARMARGEIDGPRIIPPDRFDSLEMLLPQLAAIVRGRVSGISYDFLDCQGPRTVIRLSRIETLIGTEVGEEIELRTFGGPLPNGNYVSASELPRYAIGAPFVVFLRNTDWRFSPVMGDLAFREEVIVDRPVLIDSDGFAVTGVAEAGIERQTAQLTEAVGFNIVGIEGAREVVRPGDAGAIRECRPGVRCEAPPIDTVEPAVRDAFAVTQDPTNRFVRPAVLEGIGLADVAPAISTGEMVERIKRYADDLGISIGGVLQREPRLGCWNVTLTDPWR